MGNSSSGRPWDPEGEGRSRSEDAAASATCPSTSSASCVSSLEKTVLLHEWWLIKARDDCNRETLAVGGLTATGKAARIFNSAPIAKRYDVYTLETKDGITVRIQGLINVSRMMHNGFPLEACSNFRIGFPYNWKAYAEKYCGANANGNDSIKTPLNEGSSKKILDCLNVICEDIMARERERNDRTRKNINELVPSKDGDVDRKNEHNARENGESLKQTTCNGSMKSTLDLSPALTKVEALSTKLTDRPFVIPPSCAPKQSDSLTNRSSLPTSFPSMKPGCQFPTSSDKGARSKEFDSTDRSNSPSSSFSTKPGCPLPTSLEKGARPKEFNLTDRSNLPSSSSSMKPGFQFPTSSDKGARPKESDSTDFLGVESREQKVNAFAVSGELLKNTTEGKECSRNGAPDERSRFNLNRSSGRVYLRDCKSTPNSNVVKAAVQPTHNDEAQIRLSSEIFPKNKEMNHERFSVGGIGVATSTEELNRVAAGSHKASNENYLDKSTRMSVKKSPRKQLTFAEDKVTETWAQDSEEDVDLNLVSNTRKISGFEGLSPESSNTASNANGPTDVSTSLDKVNNTMASSKCQNPGSQCALRRSPRLKITTEPREMTYRNDSSSRENIIQNKNSIPERDRPDMSSGFEGLLPESSNTASNADGSTDVSTSLDKVNNTMEPSKCQNPGSQCALKRSTRLKSTTEPREMVYRNDSPSRENIIQNKNSIPERDRPDMSSHKTCGDGEKTPSTPRLRVFSDDRSALNLHNNLSTMKQKNSRSKREEEPTSNLRKDDVFSFPDDDDFSESVSKYSNHSTKTRSNVTAHEKSGVLHGPSLPRGDDVPRPDAAADSQPGTKKLTSRTPKAHSASKVGKSFKPRGEAANLSFASPELLNLKRSKSGRVIVPKLSNWYQQILYENGSIAGILTGVDAITAGHPACRSEPSRKRKKLL